ncbi:unnamed protein product [Bursaphelenchus xylophilus]|uniref:(pine wood nematode) hypothetical protein n=1 Tax=Bursaphelenchus xylophilus TaxID=6326 RepID=A0A1I7S0T2_BURXY|nr:unnamed protein product [Bursaphelenchus xylophilus]CAG9088398.1 unnamed protein product [Bursaphelenchus xylophilus]
MVPEEVNQFPKIDEFDFCLVVPLSSEGAEPSSSNPTLNKNNSVERAPFDQVHLKLEGISTVNGAKIQFRWNNFNVPANVNFYITVKTWLQDGQSDKKFCEVEKSRVLNETIRFSIDLVDNEEFLKNCDDFVCVFGHIVIRQSLRDAQARVPSVERNQPRIICAQLTRMLQSQAFTDCEIRSDGEVFRAHKLILAASSKVFERMLSGPFADAKSSIIDLEDVRGNVVEAMLSFLYTGSIAQFDDVGRELLYLADQYHIQNLLDFCTIKLMSSMTCELACDILTGHPSIMHLKAFKAGIIEFLIDHHKEFIQTKGWKDLAASSNVALLTELFKGFGDHVDRNIY